MEWIGEGPLIGLRRLAAALIAAAAWVGIGIHLEAQLSASSSLPAAVWVLAGYFTVLANLVVALVFSTIAFDWNASARTVAGVALAIVLVGVVYGVLLQGLRELTAGAALANILLHQVTPILVPLYWLASVPKGNLRWREPLLWAAFPLAYFAYALLRGSAEGHFAYPFIDLAAKGARQVAMSVAVIALCFLIAGWVLVWLDHRLAGHGRG
ncbi:Pr6Pr family membrane protein [Devosia nitrariae]|uniref:FAR-17a/AIG1-like protein n=1 Tax=Devosia nitrariae TaxID=2071872 RepID=A0ABQ5W843_9HYPH|nr:Pr6Pr family membrane protein [Devosia nitrariae]GLQ56270.1 hypothetical protein GCM10010862_35290 [Devosia nitrariae]